LVGQSFFNLVFRPVLHYKVYHIDQQINFAQIVACQIETGFQLTTLQPTVYIKTSKQPTTNSIHQNKQKTHQPTV
jgi:hypothetical protein